MGNALNVGLVAEGEGANWYSAEVKRAKATDNGIELAELPKNRDGPTARQRINRFDPICPAH